MTLEWVGLNIEINWVDTESKRIFSKTYFIREHISSWFYCNNVWVIIEDFECYWTVKLAWKSTSKS